MDQVLGTTDTVGDEFTLIGGEPDMFVLCDTHTGGEWVLQIRSPDGVWVDTNVTFDNTGIKAFGLPRPAVCRWNSGTVGAKIFASGVQR